MKRSKKLWDWKLFHKRKHSFRSKERHVPRSWVVFYHRSDRMKTRRSILDELNGLDGDFPLRSTRHSAKWDWW